MLHTNLTVRAQLPIEIIYTWRVLSAGQKPSFWSQKGSVDTTISISVRYKTEFTQLSPVNMRILTYGSPHLRTHIIVRQSSPRDIGHYFIDNIKDRLANN
jgi:hypothetical protein